MNYPNETPILDFTNYPYTISKSGLDVRNVDYVKFIGLHIRNNLQAVEDQWVDGFQIYTSGTVWVENCAIYGHGGYGFLSSGTDTLYLTNVDSYNNYDNNDTDPGNTADGFAIYNGGLTTDTFRVVYMEGCRAWNNSDDGIEVDYSQQLQINNCWSFSNGYANGAGEAFKSRITMIRTSSKRK